MDLTNRTLEVLRSIERPEGIVWEEMLRAACDALALVPRATMESIAVTGTLCGVEGEVLFLLALSKQLADEHGVKQVVQIDGRHFVVRFLRCNQGPHA